LRNLGATLETGPLSARILIQCLRSVPTLPRVALLLVSLWPACRRAHPVASAISANASTRERRGLGRAGRGPGPPAGFFYPRHCSLRITAWSSFRRGTTSSSCRAIAPMARLAVGRP
jgi:hypothetical protein